MNELFSSITSTYNVDMGGGSGKGGTGNHLKDGAIDLLAGTLGGVANVYAGQPLDTVKVNCGCRSSVKGYL